MTDLAPLTKAWYLLPLPAFTLRPTAVKLHGRRLVLWPTSAGWAAADAHCPHAGASLHAAELSDGCITCPFHGWQFDATGAVVNREQAQKLRIWSTRPHDHGIWVWSEPGGNPLWDPPAVAHLGSDWQLCGEFKVELCASLGEIFENIVDVEHFPPVHRTSGTPEVASLLSEGPRLVVESYHRSPASPRQRSRVKLSAYGPGMTIVEFGEPAWLRVVSFHTPIEPRRTSVRWEAYVRAPAARRQRVAAGAAFFNRILVKELMEDEQIWAHRDPSIDLRCSDDMTAVRYWLAGFREEARGS